MCVQIYKFNIPQIVFERTFRLENQAKNKKTKQNNVEIKIKPISKQTGDIVARCVEPKQNLKAKKSERECFGKKWFVSSAATVARINTRLRFY